MNYDHNIYDAYIYDIYNPKALKSGDHICSLYDTDEQYIATLIQFVKEGLIKGEKVLYFAHEKDQQRMLLELSNHIKDVDQHLKCGQLATQTTMDPYLINDGHFTADGMINFVKEYHNRSKKEGYPLLRVAGDMRLVLTKFESIEELLYLESCINRDLFWDHDCIGLCQYDMRHFSSNILNAQINVHPLCHLGNEIYLNQFYIPPEYYLSEDRQSSLLHQKIHQIKERKNREKHLAHLYKQTEELNEFSHLLVHDLKGPIGSASTLGTMLKKAPSPKIIEHLLSALEQAKDRLESITQLNSVLIPHKRSKSYVDVNTLLAQLIQDYQEEIKEIHGEFKLVQGKIKLIYINQKHVVQLFSNLINNAIRYRKQEENLKITITTEMHNAHEIMVSVQDNGMGFHSYINEKIFSPFFRSHTVLDIEGTGIGLAICKRIVQKYNGRIVATGEEGEGAKFEVYLPITNTS